MKMRRLAILAIAVLALGGCAASGAAPESTGDAHAAQVLASNVRDFYNTNHWYVALQFPDGPAGLPNVQVVASTAFVFTKIAVTDTGKSEAIAICHSVVAVAKDPDTAQPLGIRHVKVDGGSGNEELAACDTP